MTKTENRDRHPAGGSTKKGNADTHLIGMKAIADYIQRSEPTVLKLVKESGFPAKKISGIWESDKNAIGEWRIRQLSLDN